MSGDCNDERPRRGPLRRHAARTNEVIHGTTVESGPGPAGRAVRRKPSESSRGDCMIRRLSLLAVVVVAAACSPGTSPADGLETLPAVTAEPTLESTMPSGEPTTELPSESPAEPPSELPSDSPSASP